MSNDFKDSIGLPVNTLECPFCHKPPVLIKIPLWEGSHGYLGCFTFRIECKNKQCKMAVRTKNCPNTIYGKTEEECIREVIDDWNDEEILLAN